MGQQLEHMGELQPGRNMIFRCKLQYEAQPLGRCCSCRSSLPKIQEVLDCEAAKACAPRYRLGCANLAGGFPLFVSGMGSLLHCPL